MNLCQTSYYLTHDEDLIDISGKNKLDIAKDLKLCTYTWKYRLFIYLLCFGVVGVIPLPGRHPIWTHKREVDKRWGRGGCLPAFCFSVFITLMTSAFGMPTNTFYFYNSHGHHIS